MRLIASSSEKSRQQLQRATPSRTLTAVLPQVWHAQEVFWWRSDGPHSSLPRLSTAQLVQVKVGAGGGVSAAGASKSNFLSAEPLDQRHFHLCDFQLEHLQRFDELPDVLVATLEERAGDVFDLKCLALFDQREEELGEIGFHLFRFTPDGQNPPLLFPRSRHEGGRCELLWN